MCTVHSKTGCNEDKNRQLFECPAQIPDYRALTQNNTSPSKSLVTPTQCIAYNFNWWSADDYSALVNSSRPRSTESRAPHRNFQSAFTKGVRCTSRFKLLGNVHVLMCAGKCNCTFQNTTSGIKVNIRQTAVHDVTAAFRSARENHSAVFVSHHK